MTVPAISRRLPSLETGNFINQIVVWIQMQTGSLTFSSPNNTGQTVASYGIGKLIYSPEYTFGTDFGMGLCLVIGHR